MESTSTMRSLDAIESDSVEPTLYAKEFFDVPRHNLVTGTAVQFFTQTTAESVQQFFEPLGLTFDDAGGWADQIKQAHKPNDAETKAFLQDPKNKSHKTWHYVDLPLGSESYEAAAALGFARDNDVVHTIRLCVLVLQGQSDRFSPVTALRLMGHLVGDVHQPLHVACGFIDESSDPPTLVTDAGEIHAQGFKSDTGGNQIALPGAGKLHSYWDTGLGGLIGTIDVSDSDPVTGSPSGEADDTGELTAAAYEKLFRLVTQNLELKPLNAEADDPGPVENWAEAWANDSIAAAREAYKTLSIAEEVKHTSSTGSVQITYKVDWEGKASYNERCGPILQNQMTMAARRLAQMLNAIFDPDNQ